MDRELADRIRDALAVRSPVREVTMFGGLSFMVNDRMVVAARRGGGLLVRVDPERSDSLLAVEGARPAEMGTGRAMGDGWISVADEALVADESLDFWISVALAHHDRSDSGRQGRDRAKKGVGERVPRPDPETLPHGGPVTETSR